MSISFFGMKKFNLSYEIDFVNSLFCLEVFCWEFWEFIISLIDFCSWL